MKRTISKRVLSAILSVVLIFSMLNVSLTATFGNELGNVTDISEQGNSVDQSEALLSGDEIITEQTPETLETPVISETPISLLSSNGDTANFTILVTSDLHGVFQPFNYSTMTATKGSLAQAGTLIKENLPTGADAGNYLIIDAGDTIQGNGTDLFIGNSAYKPFPVIAGLESLKYDAVVLGNHEFNYTIDNIIDAYTGFTGAKLCGNVKSTSDGSYITGFKNYFIKTMPNGLRVAVIGMTNPNITSWNPDNVNGYTVSDIVTATRDTIDEIKNVGGADVYVAVEHVSKTNSDLNGKDVEDVIEACPEISVFIGAHGHTKLGEAGKPSFISTSNAALQVKFVENLNAGATIGVVKVNAVFDGIDNAWKVDKTNGVETDIISVSTTAPITLPDMDVINATSVADTFAKEYSNTQIGTLTGGPLVPLPLMTGQYEGYLQPTALIKLINDTQLYYSGAQIAGTAPLSTNANLQEGPITRGSLTQVYMYDSNLLYKLKMTGEQIKAWMEWSYGYFNQFDATTDLNITYGTMAGYNQDSFSGLNYTVDLTQPKGNRVTITTLKDGATFSPTGVYTVAANDYRSNSRFLVETAPNFLFKGIKNADGVVSGPALVLGKNYGIDKLPHDESNDNILSLLTNYIQDVKAGSITNENDNNWSFTNLTWDTTMRAAAIRLVNAGTINMVSGYNILKVTREQVIPFLTTAELNTTLASLSASEIMLLTAPQLNALSVDKLNSILTKLSLEQIILLTPLNFSQVFNSLSDTQIDLLIADPIGFNIVAAYLPISKLPSGYTAGDIIGFNDFHGALDEAMSGTALAATGNPGGAKFATAIKAEVAKNAGNAIVVSSGDSYQGSAASNINLGKPVSQIFKNIGVKYSAMGNHEFDWLYDSTIADTQINTWKTDGGLEFLCANLYVKGTKTNPSFVKPYAVETIGGIRVGIVGLITTYTPELVTAANVAGYDFADPATAVQPYIDQLKTPIGTTASNGGAGEGCDVVIALTHLDSAQSSSTGIITGDASTFAAKLIGLDAIISGHSHQNVVGTVTDSVGNKVPMVQGYYNGRSIDKLRVIKNDSGNIVGVFPYLRMISTSPTKLSLIPDAEVKSIIDKTNEILAPLLDQPVGITNSLTPMTLRDDVSKWACNVVYNYVLRTTGTPTIIITNSGGWRNVVPWGPNLKVRDMYNLMPFDNLIQTMDMTGANLIAMLDGNLRVDMSKPLISNVSFYGVDKNESGQYVLRSTGLVIDPLLTYRVMTTDFTYNGGDNYDFRSATKITIEGSNVRDAMIAQLRFEMNPDICDIVSVLSPVGAILNTTTKTITANVESTVASSTVNFTVTSGATWALYSDANCTTAISNNTMTLASGQNKAYVKVMSSSGDASTIYTIIITRMANNTNPGGGSSSSIGSSSSPSTTTNSIEIGGRAITEVIDATKNSVTLTAPANASGVAYISIPVSILNKTAKQNSKFVYKFVSGDFSCSIPANITEILQGTAASLITSENINNFIFKVTISNRFEDSTTLKTFNTKMPNAKLIKLVDFSMEVVNKSTGISTNIANFSKPVERSVLIPSSTSKTTTFGVYKLNSSSQKWEFVPHHTVTVDGKTFENIYSSTNSVYAVATNNVTFNDVSPNFWGFETISRAADEAIVEGYGNGLFLPNGKITRAEFVQMIATCLQISGPNKNAKPYSDLVSSAWYYDAVANASSEGLLKGFEGGEFKPNQPITREEMASIIAQVIKNNNILKALQSISLEDAFNDIDTIDTNFMDAVSTVYDTKIMVGKSNGLFEPNGVSTRAEAATVVVRLLKLLGSIN